MPIKILEKDPVKMKDKPSKAKWITKKGHKAEMDLGGTKKKNWITKKSDPLGVLRGQEKFKKERQPKGGRAGFQGGGRTRLLEELGRVEAEPSNRNRRAEISRVHGELNRGYKGGKRVKKGHGGSAVQQHYLQHGYGPHKMAKASDKAIKGNKLTKKA